MKKNLPLESEFHPESKYDICFCFRFNLNLTFPKYLVHIYNSYVFVDS